MTRQVRFTFLALLALLAVGAVALRQQNAHLAAEVGQGVTP